MDENFWIALGAVAALASAVGAGVSLLVGAWLRQRNRPEADWAWTATARVLEHDPHSSFNEHVGHIRVLGTFANVGDAAAARLTLSTSVNSPDAQGALLQRNKNTAAEVQGRGLLPVMMPGESIWFQATIPPQDWDDAVITLDWITSPTRLKKHRQWTLTGAEIRGAAGA